MPSKSKAPANAIENYLPDDEDFFDPFASLSNSPTQSPKGKHAGKRKEPDGELGIDEEVSVAKRARVPRVKLDETRLLSDKGIPALRKRAAQLKLKGKGHEFSDAARLLSFYQLWLDDLFPKAKFLDALAMVEKAGHKTTMHKARTDWINDLKPNMQAGHDDDTDPDTRDEPQAEKQPTRIAPIFEKSRTMAAAADNGFPDDEDIYNATPERIVGERAGPSTTVGGEPDDAELAMLMAEAESAPRAPPKPVARSLFSPGKPTSVAPDDDNDLDALMAEAEALTSTTRTVDTQRSNVTDIDDEDDLDALMAEAEAVLGQKQTVMGSVAAKISSFEDDEAAMAELEGML